jgi:hypothetical protein
MARYKTRGSNGQFMKAVTNGSNGYVTNDQWAEDMIANAMTSRQEIFSKYLDPRRDIDDEVGYPATNSITASDFRSMYEREPVAARVNDVLPDESWMVNPTVIETDNPDDITPFEEAWANLSLQLRAFRGESFFKGHEGNPIWEYLHRIDRLSGIGHFGILLLGLGGTGNDSLAKEPRVTGNPRELLFLRPMDATLVNIHQFVTDSNSPRFGQPLIYNVQLGSVDDSSQGGGMDAIRHGASLPSNTVRVHWKRVIHVVDNLMSSEVFSPPRMQPVYNRLHDLRKLYSGSAEMYWRGAFPGLSIETNPKLGTNVTVDRDAMRDMMENYMNGLQRYMTLTGMSAKSLAPQVVDPTAQIAVQVEAICIRLGIPKRIFMGSERGELASSQDDSAFNDRLRRRQNGYITPRIIVPFVDRLINLGVLPEPESYSVLWPDLDALTDDEKATVAERRTRAMKDYAQGGVMNIMARTDFLIRELGYTQGEAESILKNQLVEKETFEPIGFENPADEEEEGDEGEDSEETTKGKEEDDPSEAKEDTSA